MNNNNTSTHYSHLSDFERGQIQAYINAGLNPSEIARQLKRHRSTIIREIKRGTVTVISTRTGYYKDVEEYSPTAAKTRYIENRKKSRHRNLKESHKISQAFIDSLIDELKKKFRRFSIDSFVRYYREHHPDEKVPCTATIYRYVHQALIDLKPIDLPRMVRWKQRKKKKETQPYKKKLGNSIELRPEIIEKRQEIGHFEIDLVHGIRGKNEKVLLTLVDRKSRLGILRLLENGRSVTVNQAVELIIEEYGSHKIKSITADNGSEFSRLIDLESDGLKVYFAHPYASYERGSNENFNGLIREFMPKKVSFNKYTQEYVSKVAETINQRIRRILGYQTAEEVFNETVS